MSSSIKRGVEALSPSARVLIVALVDQPQIGPAVINQVIEAYERERPLIVVPTYDGRNGHPIAINLSLKEEIKAMDPNGDCARSCMLIATASPTRKRRAKRF